MERRFDNSAEKGITDRTLEINFGRQQQHSKVSDDQVLHHVYHRQHSSSSENSVSVSSPAVLVPHDQASFNLKSSHFHQPPTVPMGQLQQPDVETEATAFGNQQRLSNSDGDYKISSKEMKELEYFFSKLNPMAREFVPPSLTNPVAHGFKPGQYTNYGDMNMNAQENNCRRKKVSDVQRKRRINNRTNQAQRESVIRRTLYVSDIDQQVTEEQLATLFINCGQVVDCRICGDPNSVLRFAFVEFTDEEGARAALSLSGTMLGYYPVKVLPSKTAIAPVNPNYLPRTEDEREMCARTIYCTNIDRKVSQNEVRLFFESFCGEVHRLRLLGDYQHSTRIAFVEFVMAESAIAALNCSGVILGSLPIRVSPSKTPVRPRAPRLVGH